MHLACMACLLGQISEPHHRRRGPVQHPTHQCARIGHQRRNDGVVIWCQKTWLCVVNDRPVGNPKRRFDEYKSKFSLSYETKVINSVGGWQYDWRWCPLASRQLRIIYRAPRLSFASRAATWNLHTTQPNTLFPTYDEVVNLTGLLETKGMSVSSGKW
jgi:hypothetical protein